MPGVEWSTLDGHTRVFQKTGGDSGQGVHRGGVDKAWVEGSSPSGVTIKRPGAWFFYFRPAAERIGDFSKKNLPIDPADHTESFWSHLKISKLVLGFFMLVWKIELEFCGAKSPRGVINSHLVPSVVINSK
jgi:hypothetical protein